MGRILHISHPLANPFYPQGKGQGGSGCDAGWVADFDFEFAHLFEIGRHARRADEVVVAFGIIAPEDPQGGAVEGARGPLALDGVHFVAPAGEHEVHFAARLVAPVADGGVREMGLQVFQNEVFPERARSSWRSGSQPRAWLTKPVSKP